MNGTPSIQTASMRWFSWRGLLGLGSGLALVLFWGLVAIRLVMYPENHTGVSVLWAIPLALVAMLAGGLCLTAHRRRMGAVLLVLGLLTAVGAVLLDRLDILVEYEEWLERGMPERPF